MECIQVDKVGEERERGHMANVGMGPGSVPHKVILDLLQMT